MSRIIGRGRYATGVYPSRSLASAVAVAAAAVADIVPFTSSLYVDSGTTFPLAEQTGSVSRPYALIQTAIDDNPGIFLALQLVATVYAESVVVPAGTPVLFFATTVVQITGIEIAADATALSAGSLLQPGALILGANAKLVLLGSCEVLPGGSTALGANAQLDAFLYAGLVDVTVGNGVVISLRGQYKINSVTASDPGDVGELVFMYAEDLYPASPTGPHTALLGVVTAAGYSVQIVGGKCDGAITCDTLAFTSCYVDGDVVAGSVYLRDSSTATGRAFTSTGVVEIIGSNVDAATWNNAVGQAFELDAFSNYWIKINGTVLSNPGEKVITSDIIP